MSNNMLITKELLESALKEEKPLFHDGDFIDEEVYSELFLAAMEYKPCKNNVNRQMRQKHINPKEREILCKELKGGYVYLNDQCSECGKPFTHKLTKTHIVKESFKKTDLMHFFTISDEVYPHKELWEKKVRAIDEKRTYICHNCKDRFKERAVQEANEVLKLEGEEFWNWYTKANDWRTGLFQRWTLCDNPNAYQIVDVYDREHWATNECLQFRKEKEKQQDLSIKAQKQQMPTEYRMPDPIVKTAKKLLDNAGQIILQGAPGCGKTYITTELAVYLCDGQVPASRAALKARYKELEAEGRIGFTTFHQSLDYEEFVEGMKPDTENADGEMRFVVKPGIFKRMCERASKDDAPHVLIIDEINRANISKVLGELITLIEKTKRIGAEDEFCVTLPYSGERFGVPQNLYIIGTMNTADRSLGYIDYAIRRRFAFLPLKSEWAVVREFYGDRGELMNRQHDLYTRIRNLVKDHLNEDFLLDDVMIGHSYFLAATDDDYKLNLDYKIRPLLEEYLRDGILVEDGTVKDTIKNLR